MFAVNALFGLRIDKVHCTRNKYWVLLTGLEPVTLGS